MSDNGEVERMNRMLKEATVQRFHYATHEQLQQHLGQFLDAYDFAKWLKTLKGLTPCEAICEAWAESHAYSPQTRIIKCRDQTADPPADPACEALREQADGGRARSGQRRDVCAEHRLPVGRPAEGPSTGQHGQRLLPTLGLGRYVGAHQSRARRPMPQGGRARGQPDHGDRDAKACAGHRQPERQGRGTRRCSVGPPGYDGGKKIKGRRRPVLVDMQGLLMHAVVHATDLQDRDGDMLLIGTLFGLHPFLLKLNADAGYQGAKFQDGLKAVCRTVNVEIVRRRDLHTFACHPSAGLLNAPSLGSIAAAAWPRTGSAGAAQHSHSFYRPQSA